MLLLHTLRECRLMAKPTDSKPVTEGSSPSTPAKEYSTWVIEHSVFYLYSVDWVYDIEHESPKDLQMRMLLHDN